MITKFNLPSYESSLLSELTMSVKDTHVGKRIEIIEEVRNQTIIETRWVRENGVSWHGADKDMQACVHVSECAHMHVR